MNCPVKLVLDGGEEFVCYLRLRIIVAAGRIDIRNLAVEVPLRCANLPDALDKFVEVVVPGPAILQPLIIKSEALDDILPQSLRCPNSELGASMGPYS